MEEASPACDTCRSGDEALRHGRHPQGRQVTGHWRAISQHYTPVGYGLEQSGPKTALGGDTRRKADEMLVNLNGVFNTGKGTSAKFSNNNGTVHQGGTCFGDSGGPIFQAGTTVVVAVTSFGISQTCGGSTGAYRMDQQDDLDFLASFGITPLIGIDQDALPTVEVR